MLFLDDHSQSVPLPRSHHRIGSMVDFFKQTTILHSHHPVPYLLPSFSLLRIQDVGPLPTPDETLS